MATNKNVDRSAVIAMYEGGAAASECASHFGLAKSTICKIVKEDRPNAIRKRGNSGQNRRKFSYTPEITGSVLEKFFSYNPQNGIFTHLTRRGPRSGGPGANAGMKMNNGYISIGIPGKRILAHRLAWLWMTGTWPSSEIDHINGDRSDNRFCNLREADRSQNSRNGGRRITNKSGIVGVFFDKSRGKYVASVIAGGRDVYRKRFDTLEQAVEARKREADRFFGQFVPTQRDGYPER